MRLRDLLLWIAFRVESTWPRCRLSLSRLIGMSPSFDAASGCLPDWLLLTRVSVPALAAVPAEQSGAGPGLSPRTAGHRR